MESNSGIRPAAALGQDAERLITPGLPTSLQLENVPRKRDHLRGILGYVLGLVHLISIVHKINKLLIMGSH